MTLVTKTCSACGEHKPPDAFYKDRSRRDGLSYICKECAISRGKAYRLRNAQLIKEKHAVYREANRDALRAAGRRYMRLRREDPGFVRAERENCDKEYHKAYSARHYQENKAEYARRHRAWYEANPGKAAEYFNRRRSIIRGQRDHFTADEFSELCASVGWRCVCCAKKTKLHADHIVPLSMGGANTIDNIQPLCKSCNSKMYTNTINYMADENSSSISA